jgi:hypothetical protein
MLLLRQRCWVSAFFGLHSLSGAVAMIEAGKTIVNENEVDDPAPVLAQSLIKVAETHYGVMPATNASVPIDTTDVQKLAHAASGADLLLDVHIRSAPKKADRRTIPGDSDRRIFSMSRGRIWYRYWSRASFHTGKSVRVAGCCSNI